MSRSDNADAPIQDEERTDAPPKTMADVERDIQASEDTEQGDTEQGDAAHKKRVAELMGWADFERLYLNNPSPTAGVRVRERTNFRRRQRINTHYNSRVNLLENYAQDAVKLLAIMAVRFLHAEHGVARRTRARTPAMPAPGIMSVGESISRMDPLLLRAIMYMAAECDPITGVPLSQVAQTEWLKGFQ